MKKTSYVLDMFPYPSGEGLHMGHAKVYSASDIYSRYKRMTGFDVLHPTGFDAFGLPAEQYAIKNKVNPNISTKKNCDNFLRQMKELNLSYDYDKVFSTTDPEFYRWTQWIFKQLYKKDLAYESFEPINWCPSCMTGLANEDLEDGKCERCGSIVEKKPLRQWVLKITDYADRLLDDLDTLTEWQPWVKDLQRNWIGRSEGSEIDFKIFAKDFDGKFTVFTTRADTLFGCTYTVLAPEHDLVRELLDKNIITNAKEVENYISEVKDKTDIERGAEGREKTGVKLEGVMAINPANQKEVPVYIADYVLASYGTGAIMAVPAHDVRDGEFAKKYGIEILDIEVVDTDEERKRITDIVGGKLVKKYKLRDWVFARQRYWGEPFPIVFDEKHKSYLVADSELPVRLPEVESYEPTGTGESPLANIVEFTDVYGYINDEDEFESVKGLDLNKYKDQPIDLNLGDGKDRFQNNKEIKERNNVACIIKHPTENKYLVSKWKSVNWNGFLTGGIEEGETPQDAVKKELKEETGFVDIKDIKDFNFTSHAIFYHPVKNQNRFAHYNLFVIELNSLENVGVAKEEADIAEFVWVDESEVLETLSRYDMKSLWEFYLNKSFTPNNNIKLFKRETNTMPQWAGSSWYWLRFPDAHNDKEIFSKESQEKFGVVDIYVGGVEHATRHLIYGRFWHKFLYDLGIVKNIEPFKRLETVGLVLGEGGVKMSKRLGNIINPDDVIRDYGSDVARMYVMFMGPFGQTGVWDSKSISGVKRFLDRVKKLESKIDSECKNQNIIHQTVKKVGEDIEEFKFNTAISQMMILVNEFEEKGLSQTEYDNLMTILAPFAPEMCAAYVDKSWPVWDEGKLTADEVTIVIQVNGKLRGDIKSKKDLPDEEIISTVKASDTWAKYVTDEPKKVIIIKNKLVNIVI